MMDKLLCDNHVDFFPISQPPGDSDAYGSGNVSSKFLYEEVFYDVMASIAPDTRRLVGHKKDTLILDCQMNGRECDE